MTLLGRIQPQKSFGDEALELHVSDKHFLVKVAGLVNWGAFDGYWPKLYGVTGKPSRDPLVCFKMLLLEPVVRPVRSGMRSAMRGSTVLPALSGLVAGRHDCGRNRAGAFPQAPGESGNSRSVACGGAGATGGRRGNIKRGTLVDAAIVQSARKSPPKGEKGSDQDADWAVKDGKAIAWRYVGLAKNRLHFMLLAIVHNLRRWPPKRHGWSGVRLV